jgi:hypothetical protein
MSSAWCEKDVEIGALRDGYPALASWITRDPDGEPLIFRKFGKVAVRSILHQPAQLIALEYELEQLDADAQNSPDLETRQSLRDLGGTKSQQCLIQLEGAIWNTVKCPD